MNIYFLIAGILCFVLGLVHSVLGEYLIFRDKRNKGTVVPTKVKGDLKGRHLRIIWATWHVVTVLGWLIGAFLIKISFDQNILNLEFIGHMVLWTIYAMIASSFFVLIGTKGKHPGWLVFLIIAILLMIGK